MKITENHINSFNLESLSNFKSIAVKGNEIRVFENKVDKALKIKNHKNSVRSSRNHWFNAFSRKRPKN
ncbi:hypothetical protein [Parachlamydia acanthamoebae]|uniref:Uncharacterized protein n=1 Tax=Parachlamydia acanthamoebae TaxID=83552 RepID=A0A0C1EC19_9BACT|nr:hypothetical protein [Parachlamydia acanthamoebae]KIA77583.1 hypothetical protein DB43_GD00140 [Parachlamydia acanthamoebae]